MAGYEAGVCNIDQDEVRMRYYSSIVVFAFVLLFVGMQFYYPQDSGLLGYMPLYFSSATGFILYFQARESFCTGYALRSKQKVEGSFEKVSDPEKVSKDRKKALEMILMSLVASTVLTGAVYLLAGYLPFLPIL